MKEIKLSKYQKEIVGKLKTGGFITHNEGPKLNAYYVNGEHKEKVRFQTIEILCGLEVIKYVDGTDDYKMILSQKTV